MGIVFCSCAIFLGCCGIGNSYPEYFKPIIQEELESSEELGWVMDKWWDKGEEAVSFDLEENLTSADDWNWLLAGLFLDEKENKGYACLQAFNMTGSEEKEIVRDPQFIVWVMKYTMRVIINWWQST